MSVQATFSAPKVLLGTALLAVIGFSPLQPVHAATPKAAVSSLQSIATAQVNDFTSSQWLKGSWRQSAGLSIPATAANKAAFRKGVQVRTADGQVRTGKNGQVDRVGDDLRAHRDRH